LKTKWRQRAIVSAAARDSRAEQVRMCEEVGRHESSVTMAADTYSIWIGHSHRGGLLDCSFRVHHNLLDVGIVHLLRRADHRHRHIVENRVTLQCEEQLRGSRDGHKPPG